MQQKMQKKHIKIVKTFLKENAKFLAGSSLNKPIARPLIVVLGPTASGKTALSLDVARQIKGEIISTDSRQLYKGMKISTDTISKKDQKGIPHHFLGITTPDKPVTLAEYQDMAFKKIEEIYGHGHIPMLVGGTGLYISAIIEGYKIPRIAPDKKLRAKLMKEAKEKGPEYLYSKLKKLDPKAAKIIHPNNVRYVVRALEINLTTGKNKSDKKSSLKSSSKASQNFDVLMLGINWPRQELYKRINQRVDLQLKIGLIKEVEKLLKKGYSQRLPAMSSLGVKEIIPYIKGKMPLDQCVEILKMNTRRYAKRQMTWFRRYANVVWLKPE